MIKKIILFFSTLSLMASFILSFQNCSDVNFESLKEGSSILMKDDVFGNNSVITPSKNNQSIQAIDDKGRPIVTIPDPVLDEKNCPGCKDLIKNLGINEKDLIANDRVICSKDIDLSKHCGADEVFVGGKCIFKCPENQIFVDNKCVDRSKDCEIVGGQGLQYWASNAYGKCVAQKCDEEKGYKLEKEVCVYKCAPNQIFYNGKCFDPVKKCSINNGTAQALWSETDYGACKVIDCHEGYKKQNETCVPICKPGEDFYKGTCNKIVDKCSIENGQGEKKWNGMTYGECKVVDCAPGFKKADTKCVSQCNQNEIFANGKCNPPVVSCLKNNGTGQQEWSKLSNSYGACKVVDCNTGYKILNNNCVPICTADEILINGVCTQKKKDCVIPNGIGQTEISSSGLEVCKPILCNKNFQMVNNKCVDKCPPGQISWAGKCYDQKKDCTLLNGTGTQSWIGDEGYGPCTVDRCNDGFVKSGNLCVDTCKGIKCLKTGARGSCTEWSRTPASTCCKKTCGVFDLLGGQCNESWHICPPPPVGDPLVIDLGNKPEKMNFGSQFMGILYDLIGSFKKPIPNQKVLISWTKNPRYAYLTLPNSKGEVLGIDQLFGDNTKGPDGLGAHDGFAALSKYDGKDVTGKNKLEEPNGILNSKDAIFSSLRLWTDTNGNGVAEPSELKSFEQMGIASINLDYDGNFHEVDQWGNKVTYKSEVTFTDGRKTLIFDVWFRYFEPVKPGCYKF